jgi:hypothetical protein
VWKKLGVLCPGLMERRHCLSLVGEGVV